MRKVSIVLRDEPKRRIAALIGFTTCVLLMAGYAKLSRAERPPDQTFPSAELAAKALYLAVRNGDQGALSGILGAGREAVSSEDPVQDRIDRQRFARKYREMHRLAREPDGTEVLYVGAENWPFPFPLVAADAGWRFDTEAGMEEVLLRRIGEDEVTAIATCRGLVAPEKASPSSPDASAPANEDANAALTVNVSKDDRAVPFHGSYFRLLRAPRTSTATTASTSGTSDDASQAAGPLAVVAYPAEYRVTGVMTFVVGRDGTVYEADLGPHTVAFAKALRELDPTLSWHAVR